MLIMSSNDNQTPSTTLTTIHANLDTIALTIIAALLCYTANLQWQATILQQQTCKAVELVSKIVESCGTVNLAAAAEILDDVALEDAETFLHTTPVVAHSAESDEERGIQFLHKIEEVAETHAEREVVNREIRDFFESQKVVVGLVPKDFKWDNDEVKEVTKWGGRTVTFVRRGPPNAPLFIGKLLDGTIIAWSTKKDLAVVIASDDIYTPPQPIPSTQEDRRKIHGVSAIHAIELQMVINNQVAVYTLPAFHQVLYAILPPLGDSTGIDIISYNTTLV